MVQRSHLKNISTFLHLRFFDCYSVQMIQFSQILLLHILVCNSTWFFALIHPFSTIFSSTCTRNLHLIILKIKLKKTTKITVNFKLKRSWFSHLVIVRKLLAPVDPPGREDDDVGVGDVDGLGDTVGVAAVVDISGHAPRHGGVHHPVIVQAEHVDASVLILVMLLSDVC